jgi:hypothetical protein
MRDPIQATLSAIERDPGGIAIVWCPDLGLREWLAGEVEALIGSDRLSFRAASLEDALDSPDRVALWLPGNESEAVLDLDGSRDRLRNPEKPRTQPIVLFLLRHGDGAALIASQATSLWSIAGGSDVDPESLAEIDVPAERERFARETGKTPEAWLEDWRAGRVAANSATLVTYYWAKLLEAP